MRPHSHEAGLAQLVEHLICNQGVAGSIPAAGTKNQPVTGDAGLALRQTQGTLKADAPDWQPWLLFVMRALHQQMRTLAQKVERERSAVELSDLAVKILDYARTQGRVTTRDLVREHAASANTLKSTFGTLVKKGLLVRQGGGRSIWYRLP
jgi:hypothetical protein